MVNRRIYEALIHFPGAAVACFPALLLACGFSLGGCAAAPDPDESRPAVTSGEGTSGEGTSGEENADANQQKPYERAPISDTHPYQINNYLVYPVKWSRAEDLAATVEPLFRERYGSGVVIIPHIPTNKLLIYLPPPHLRQREGARTGSGSGMRSGLPGSASRGVTGRGSTGRSSTGISRGRTTR